MGLMVAAVASSGRSAAPCAPMFPPLRCFRCNRWRIITPNIRVNCSLILDFFGIILLINSLNALLLDVCDSGDYSLFFPFFLIIIIIMVSIIIL